MSGIKSNLINLGKSFDKLKASIREPQYMGTGIWVEQCFKPDELVPGDTFFDLDLGSVTWDGRKWQQDDDINKNVKA